MFVLWSFVHKSCGCSKGDFVDKFVRDPNKTPESSQRPPHNCFKCGNPVDENEIFQDFLNTSKSSNDNTNIVNAPQEPFVFNQDPDENSSQSPPYIDHHCCYGCGDSLNGIFCQRCTWNEHLDTIPTTESDKVIKSSVEDLVPIPSESEGVPDNMYDVPFRDNYPPLNISKYRFEDFFDFNDDSTLIDDDYFSIDDIDYVEASPPDYELVSLEEVKDNILHEKLLNIHFLVAKIESLNDNLTPDRVLKSPALFPIPVKGSDSFFEKSDTSLSYSDNSLPEFDTFTNHTEETSSSSTTTHADYSLPEYDSFIFKIEPDQGELTSVVMEDNFGEPRVHVPNVLPTHPTLMLDLNFIPSDDSLRSDLDVSFPSRTKNKIFDPGIIEVQPKNFLSRDTLYISFIRDPLCPVIETLLPFSSENKDQVFNPGILSSKLLSHRGKIIFYFSENPMMIYEGNIPTLEVPFLHFYPP
nr:hypothetical protein [Tanacetum cinerariifolium]